MAISAPVFTVSQLTRTIKGVLEEGFSNITVEGELSNCKVHSSGHMYFTMKDANAQLSCVMWRNRVANLFFTPQDGMRVVARGSITVYEPRGNYQLDAAVLRPAGVGELQLAFERLKQRLSAEGLFDQKRKRPLPPYPRRIGIVTSPTGAALQDICHIISRRFPLAELVLVPVRVQGAEAPQEIAEGITALNRLGGVDVMIVGRGGGSLEDLWAFNEEVVARAIFSSAVPVISAVGHEIDYTIADFVADLRAPTPSAAAELVVPDKRQILELVRNFCYTAEQLICRKISQDRRDIIILLESSAFHQPVYAVREHMQTLDDLFFRLRTGSLLHLRLKHERLNALEKRAGSVNPRNVLQRGYALIHRNGTIVTRSAELCAGDDVQIELSDGRKKAEVQ